MKLWLLLPFFFTQFFNAQIQVTSLIDSLSQTSSNQEKARLSMLIASELSGDDWTRALHYIEIAEKSAKNSKSDKVLADFHIVVAEIYAEKGAWDITLENLLQAFTYYRDKPLKDRYRLENDLAIAYAETQNQEKALEYFHKIYGYEHTRKNPVNLASISNNMGLAWMEKDLDSSVFYFNKSLELIKDVDAPGLKTLLYTNLGKSSVLREDYDAAKNYFHQAIRQVDPKDSAEDLAWVYGEFSELFLKNRNLDSAIYYSRNAVDILDTVAPYSLEQLQAVKILYKAYQKNGNFENAVNNFEKFMVITDSLNLEDKRIKVQKLILEEEYRTKDKIRELEENESRANFYTLITGLIALLSILGIFAYRFWSKFKRTELEKQLASSKQNELRSNLELKNKELIGKAMIEMHRSEIIEDILKDLKEIKLKADKKEIQQAIDYIGKRLQRDTSTNLWDEFELRFEQVHESFYKNLIKTHPDLTPKDKRLCALLKLNLTSKEISQITGQTTKTVENARTRLRKKLDITNSQTDLSTYLSSFG
ncbi:hypothetical protein EI546_01430 [Aequorivita sp. H23M31]|uniref:HTH luxR-type domain-containing protein n=1 Tax=Aequorivita ciconiae TaxID=2494375 RepID=A0A410FZP0_9FLAO|nr:hypothetical protein [Aequorivita sp. H23M31]QAA80470.1 hypothetical protein EI546_01430 [Aequorivita sp. H23M31]